MRSRNRRVVCAAIKYRDGKIVLGVRHFDELMRAIAIKRMVANNPCEQGFVDNRGVFMTRKEAYIVAQAAGQLLRRVDGPPEILFSEHLY